MKALLGLFVAIPFLLSIFVGTFFRELTPDIIQRQLPGCAWPAVGSKEDSPLWVEVVRVDNHHPRYTIAVDMINASDQPLTTDVWGGRLMVWNKCLWRVYDYGSMNFSRREITIPAKGKERIEFSLELDDQYTPQDVCGNHVLRADLYALKQDISSRTFTLDCPL